MSDPTRDEMLAFLVGQYPDADGCEFDIEAAIYWFSSDYHGGQWSNLYAALSQSPYTPSPLAHGVDHEGDIAVELYEMLEDEFIVPAYTVG
jgi:hypothetical protein